jgi:nucleolar protein 56
VPAYLLPLEGGIALVAQDGSLLDYEGFASDRVYALERVLEGEGTGELDRLLKRAKALGLDELRVPSPGLAQRAQALGLRASVIEAEGWRRLTSLKLRLMQEAGLAQDEEEAAELVRSFSVQRLERRLREFAAKPERSVIEAIRGVEELDKASNIFWARLREWYGLHFPELELHVQDMELYARFVREVGRRELAAREALLALGMEEKQAASLLRAAKESKGAEVREGDLREMRELAALLLNMLQLRRQLSSYVQRNMEQLAPNVTQLVGALVGAKLLAKVGSLERLASLPASTIQVLGAEKALFRALRTGTRPPKHGILFQHPLVHGAPKWQRGKVARLLANLLAIAARVDYFKGELDEGLRLRLEEKVKEIKERYAKPPQPAKGAAKAYKPRRR